MTGQSYGTYTDLHPLADRVGAGVQRAGGAAALPASGYPHRRRRNRGRHDRGPQWLTFGAAERSDSRSAGRVWLRLSDVPRRSRGGLLQPGRGPRKPAAPRAAEMGATAFGGPLLRAHAGRIVGGRAGTRLAGAGAQPVDDRPDPLDDVPRCRHAGAEGERAEHRTLRTGHPGRGIDRRFRYDAAHHGAGGRVVTRALHSISC